MSLALDKEKLLVDKPLEAFPRVKRCRRPTRRVAAPADSVRHRTHVAQVKALKYKLDHDLGREDVRRRLRLGIRIGWYRYWRVGIPCRSWGRAGIVNFGTRSRSNPGGDGS